MLEMIAQRFSFIILDEAFLIHFGYKLFIEQPPERQVSNVFVNNDVCCISFVPRV